MTLSIMILGAGPLQVPAIHEAAALGLRSIAIDQNPRAVGLRGCDSPHVANILDADTVTDIARREKIDGVLTLCSDAPVRTVAAVGNRLSLCALTEAAAARATDKRLMRAAFDEHGAPSPQAVEVEKLEQAEQAAGRIGYPVALKIGRGSGSRGVYKLDDRYALPQAFVDCREYQ